MTKKIDDKVFTPEIELAETKFVDRHADEIVEAMRQNLAKNMGVTVMGSWVTVRFSIGKRFCNVSMQITSITDSTIREEPEEDK